MGGEDFPALGMCDRVEDLKTSAECGSLEELTRGWGSRVSLAGSPGACTGTGRVGVRMATSSTPDALGWSGVKNARASSS